mmetsp:Transcript_80668/g.207695  ORF Transcript_80668/g.207695 Transcript_80668/m.207695 type:complete len:230 (-) Transcript_80668:85-774(-)
MVLRRHGLHRADVRASVRRARLAPAERAAVLEDPEHAGARGASRQGHGLRCGARILQAAPGEGPEEPHRRAGRAAVGVAESEDDVEGLETAAQERLDARQSDQLVHGLVALREGGSDHRGAPGEGQGDRLPARRLRRAGRGGQRHPDEGGARHGPGLRGRRGPDRGGGGGHFPLAGHQRERRDQLHRVAQRDHGAQHAGHRELPEGALPLLRRRLRRQDKHQGAGRSPR